jgi:hypothetical protein
MPSDDTPPMSPIESPVVDPEDRPRSSAPRARGRTRPRSLLVRLLPVLIVVVALGGFVGLVAYYYMAAGHNGVAPLIKADQQPFKVKPENPGGMTVPDQDKEIYDRIGRADQSSVPPPNTERLLPPPETPLPNPAPAAAPAPSPSAVAQAPAPPPPGTMSAPAANPPPAKPNAANPNPSAANPNVGSPVLGAPPPQRVSTLSTVPPVPPGTSPPPPQSASTASKPAAPATPAKSTARASQTASASPAAAAPHATSGPLLRAAIASLRTEAEARKEWERQRRLYPAALASVTPSYASIDLGSKGVYWRIYVGPAEPSAEARARCATLKQKNVDCFVARP